MKMIMCDEPKTILYPNLKLRKPILFRAPLLLCLLSLFQPFNSGTNSLQTPIKCAAIYPARLGREFRAVQMRRELMRLSDAGRCQAWIDWDAGGGGIGGFILSGRQIQGEG